MDKNEIQLKSKEYNSINNIVEDHLLNIEKY